MMFLIDKQDIIYDQTNYDNSVFVSFVTETENIQNWLVVVVVVVFSTFANIILIRAICICIYRRKPLLRNIKRINASFIFSICYFCSCVFFPVLFCFGFHRVPLRMTVEIAKLT